MLAPWRREILKRVYALAIIAALGVVAWCWMVRMPGNSRPSPASALHPDEVALRGELAGDVQMLAGTIGERNIEHYAGLKAAAEFIEQSFAASALPVRRDGYDVEGKLCENIEAEIRGRSDEIVVVGAHYDSVLGSPGANDNGSGVAAMLALARRFAHQSGERTLRFVAFVNEEPANFQTDKMGSWVYASRCRARGEKIVAMISLETVGYFSDAPNSQKFPLRGLGLLYPTTGNFIGFVSNTSSRRLMCKALATFRAHAQLPSEGAALPAAVPGVGWSDHWSFWQHGYPAFMVTDTAPFRYPHYHARSDTPDQLDYDAITRLVTGFVPVLRQLLDES